jgi:hypothetical protein
MYLPPCPDDELRQISAPTLLLMGDRVIYNATPRCSAPRLIPHIQRFIGAGHEPGPAGTGQQRILGFWPVNGTENRKPKP